MLRSTACNCFISVECGCLGTLYCVGRIGESKTKCVLQYPRLVAISPALETICSRPSLGTAKSHTWR